MRRSPPPAPVALTGRRQLLRVGGSAAALLATGTLPWLPEAAHAQPTTPGWPARPVRLVVSFPPGGLADVMARVMQPALTTALGQPVVIDNRGGAAGNLAADVVVKAGDGHSFLITTTTLESVNPVLFERMPIDPAKDLVPTALLANSRLFLCVRQGLPTPDLKALVAYAKAHPGKLSYGSAGSGTTPHLAGEMFKQNAGLFATHVPYRGAAPVIQDLLAGQVDFGFVPGTALPSVRAGKLQLLGVASRSRAPEAPEAPTLLEAGYGEVLADTYFGLYAPAGTPPAVVQRLNAELNRILALPATKQRFLDISAEPAPMSPSEFKALVEAESRRFGAIVRARRITAD